MFTQKGYLHLAYDLTRIDKSLPIEKNGTTVQTKGHGDGMMTAAEGAQLPEVEREVFQEYEQPSLVEMKDSLGKVRTSLNIWMDDKQAWRLTHNWAKTMLDVLTPENPARKPISDFVGWLEQENPDDSPIKDLVDKLESKPYVHLGESQIEDTVTALLGTFDALIVAHPGE